MNDREKQIEEMAEHINNMRERNAHYYAKKNDKIVTLEAFADSYAIAEELIKYYQPKLPEGSVVISKEEYESVQKLFTYDKPMLDRIDNFSKEIKDQARKQAVKELIEKAENKPLYICDEYDDDIVEKVILLKSLKEIAKEMGVEIKE